MIVHQVLSGAGPVDAVTRQHLAARGVSLARGFTAAAGHLLQLVAQFGHKAAHDVGVAREFLG